MAHELDVNRAQWNERTIVHAASDFYDVAGFRAGQQTLRALELEEVGDVRGKRLLHLQCHFGLDTLSWARLGASVTGVDFSSEAIALARELAAELELEASFVCSDVYELRSHLRERFDIVFASYGVLVWLPDLVRWAQLVAHFLAEGGFFYLVDGHPVGVMLEEQDGRLVAVEPYFDVGPVEVPGGSTYADPEAVLANAMSYQWQHSLADVVSALAGEGLRIEFLHEFPFAASQRVPGMVRGEDAWWRLPDRNDVPFLFSIRASKDRI
ncbi:MAG: class I SAM-dependent methyltransferase [Gaiellaceae bacterium MAG52_C11]|nr:class I SAM-dependent methyltransferase [Candidatus Gaiellasilicea maunaloa]